MISSELSVYSLEASQLEEVERNLTSATRAVFGSYEIEIEPEDEVLNAVQQSTAEMVIELADDLDRTIEEQFGILREDVADPQSDRAQKTIYLVLGRAHGEHNIRAIELVSGAILADNYSTE